MAAGGVPTLEPSGADVPFPVAPRSPVRPTASGPAAATVPAMSDRCDSCGDDGPDLATVQRIYVGLDEHRQPTVHRLSDEFETWCPVCRITYPHQAVDAEA